jgi:hypothetical protein
MVIVRILMSKFGFKDEVLIKLIVGVVKHVTIDELGAWRTCALTIEAAIDFCRQQLHVRRESQ